MIDDAAIKVKFDAFGNHDEVIIQMLGQFFKLSRYEAFRFSRFLETAIMESCRLSGKKIDEDFSR